jgi:hypothetical protein
MYVCMYHKINRQGRSGISSKKVGSNWWWW